MEQICEQPKVTPGQVMTLEPLCHPHTHLLATQVQGTHIKPGTGGLGPDARKPGARVSTSIGPSGSEGERAETICEHGLWVSVFSCGGGWGAFSIEDPWEAPGSPCLKTHHMSGEHNYCITEWTL